MQRHNKQGSGCVPVENTRDKVLGRRNDADAASARSDPASGGPWPVLCAWSMLPPTSGNEGEAASQGSWEPSNLPCPSVSSSFGCNSDGIAAVVPRSLPRSAAMDSPRFRSVGFLAARCLWRPPTVAGRPESARAWPRLRGRALFDDEVGRRMAPAEWVRVANGGRDVDVGLSRLSAWSCMLPTNASTNAGLPTERSREYPRDTCGGLATAMTDSGDRGYTMVSRIALQETVTLRARNAIIVNNVKLFDDQPSWPRCR